MSAIPMAPNLADREIIKRLRIILSLFRLGLTIDRSLKPLTTYDPLVCHGGIGAAATTVEGITTTGLIQKGRSLEPSPRFQPSLCQ